MTPETDTHPPTDQPVINLEGISKRYVMGSVTVDALVDVSLRICKGEFWAIMGSSGSGKSTLLNLLGCLDRPTQGRYQLAGHDVSHLDDNALSDIRLQSLGFIFQSFNLMPHLTVLRNIELPLYYQGWARDDSQERARQLAIRVGLEARLHHRPTELSGGQCQRVAIARSLANDPPVILADEPTGNLDSRTGAEIMTMLHDLNAQGKIIIMVTHEPDIAAYANHQMQMRDGRIIRQEKLS